MYRKNTSLSRDAWSPGLLERIDQKRFEFLAAAYFETLAFRPELTQKGPEGLVDIRLYAPNEMRAGIIAHCRAWSTLPVGVKEVRELNAVMIFERVTEGAVVAAGTFAREARDFAQGRNILLIDGADLVAKIRCLPAAKQQELLQYANDGDLATPTCGTCGMKMVRMQHKSDEQPYWDCVRHPLRKVAARDYS